MVNAYLFNSCKIKFVNYILNFEKSLYSVDHTNKTINEIDRNRFS